MSIRMAAFAAATFCVVSPLSAQTAPSDFGGAFHLGFSADASDMRLSKRELGFGAEARAGTYGGQVEYTNSRLNNVGQSYDSYGLHLNFAPTPGTAVGGFYTHESGATFGTASYYGVEGNFGFDQADIEAYIGFAQSGTFNGTTYGVRGDMAAREGIDIFAGIDHVGLSNTSVTRIGLGGEVQVVDRFGITAEIGTSIVNQGATRRSGAYIGIGGSVAFGTGKPSFSRRGLIDQLPGF